MAHEHAIARLTEFLNKARNDYEQTKVAIGHHEDKLRELRATLSHHESEAASLDASLVKLQKTVVSDFADVARSALADVIAATPSPAKIIRK